MLPRVVASTDPHDDAAKVQGRFDDVTFVDTPDQIVRLIADSVEHLPTRRAMTKGLGWAEAATEDVERFGLSAYFSDSGLVQQCFPIHPVAPAALPELCSQYGHHERTFVTFLTSGEPDSVGRPANRPLIEVLS
jgi:hypothetical protein